MVPLDDFGDCEIAALPERLAAARDWDARLALVESVMVRRLCAAPAGEPGVDWAYGEIIRRSGKIRIGALAQRLGWSRRRLVERFRLDCGLAPKAIARVARFSAAHAMAAAAEPRDWADIAVACGYSDQSHLIREFAAFAGVGPTRWRFPS
jgi:AraC-like DNA-binding protein